MISNWICHSHSFPFATGKHKNIACKFSEALLLNLHTRMQPANAQLAQCSWHDIELVRLTRPLSDLSRTHLCIMHILLAVLTPNIFYTEAADSTLISYTEQNLSLQERSVMLLVQTWNVQEQVCERDDFQH